MTHKIPSVKKLLSCCIAPYALALLAFDAAALGVSDITLNSKLGQPLSAVITLLEAEDLAEHELIISQASQQIYKQMGIERSYLGSTIIIERTDLNTISLTTHKPIKEPYLNFVLQFSWPSGDVVKEFKLLVDPE